MKNKEFQEKIEELEQKFTIFKEKAYQADKEKE